MGIRHHAAAGLLCAVLALAGCAASRAGSGTGAESSPVPTPAGSSPSAGASVPPSATSLVLTGQVEQGVEAGCLILKDAGKSYELMGGDPAVVKAGARVRVTGYVAVGVMSHCMQGQPFRVTEAHAL
jgi:hypothetical protein